MRLILLISICFGLLMAAQPDESLTLKSVLSLTRMHNELAKYRSLKTKSEKVKHAVRNTLDGYFETIISELDHNIGSFDDAMKIKESMDKVPSGDQLYSLIKIFEETSHGLWGEDKERIAKYGAALKIWRLLCRILRNEIRYEESKREMNALDPQHHPFVERLKEKFDFWWLRHIVDNWYAHDELLIDLNHLLESVKAPSERALAVMKEKLLIQFKQRKEEALMETFDCFREAFMSDEVLHPDFLKPLLKMQGYLQVLKFVPETFLTELQKDIDTAKGLDKEQGCHRWLEMAIIKLEHGYIPEWRYLILLGKTEKLLNKLGGDPRLAEFRERLAAIKAPTKQLSPEEREASKRRRETRNPKIVPINLPSGKKGEQKPEVKTEDTYTKKADAKEASSPRTHSKKADDKEATSPRTSTTKGEAISPRASNKKVEATSPRTHSKEGHDRKKSSRIRKEKPEEPSEEEKGSLSPKRTEKDDEKEKDDKSKEKKDKKQ